MPDGFVGRRLIWLRIQRSRFHSGDVRRVRRSSGRFSTVIHAATPSGSRLDQGRPRQRCSILSSVARAEVAVTCGARRFLLISSGAVYGKSFECLQLTKTSPVHRMSATPCSAYAEGKRVAELLCAIYHQRHGLEAKIAARFAFISRTFRWTPILPRATFCATRYRRAYSSGRRDSTPYRSYLYAADMAIWLWTILIEGHCPGLITWGRRFLYP